MSMLFITHDLGIVRKIADRVCVMLKGEIVEQGTVEDVFGNPQHEYTSGFWRRSRRAAPILSPTMRRRSSRRVPSRSGFRSSAASCERTSAM